MLAIVLMFIVAAVGGLPWLRMLCHVFAMCAFLWFVAVCVGCSFFGRAVCVVLVGYVFCILL